jgi:hypothetical protein
MQGFLSQLYKVCSSSTAYLMGMLALSTGVKYLESEDDHSLASSAEVENTCSSYLHAPNKFLWCADTRKIN